MCGQCAKRDRACKWTASGLRYKAYQPAEASTRFESVRSPGSVAADATQVPFRSPVKGSRIRAVSRSDAGSELSPTDPAAASSIETLAATGNTDRSAPKDAQYSQEALPFTQAEASLVHHYIEELSRWLDCTDGSRHFALKIPGEAKHCPLLRYAVLSFAARHQNNNEAAQIAHQQCISLLIHRLNEVPTSHSDTLLCAIVVTHFREQLFGKHLKCLHGVAYAS